MRFPAMFIRPALPLRALLLASFASCAPATTSDTSSTTAGTSPIESAPAGPSTVELASTSRTDRTSSAPRFAPTEELTVGPVVEADAEPTDAGELVRYTSRRELVDQIARTRNAMLAELSAEQRRERFQEHQHPTSDRPRDELFGDRIPPRPWSSSATNDPVAGVAEGDLFGTSGEDLVVLRHDELVRIAIGDATPRVTGRCPVVHGRVSEDDSFDELFVDGDIALVVGNSPRLEASVVRRFSLQPDGAIVPLDILYVRSGDHYSPGDYTARLVAGRLVFYTPIALIERDLYDDRLHTLTIKVGSRGRWIEPIDYRRVVGLAAMEERATLHAVMRCDVHARALACSADGAIASPPRVYYASQTANYLWTESSRRGRTRSEPAIVRLALDERADAGIVFAKGEVVDSFAFDERDDRLRVLVRGDVSGHEMWRPGLRRGAVGLLDVPLSRFRGGRAWALPDAAVTTLVERFEDGGRFEVRWSGGRVVFASTPPAMYVYRAEDRRLFRIELDHALERIAPLGADAIGLARTEAGLSFASLDLGGRDPSIRTNFVLERGSDGASRLHALHYLSSGPDRGVLGVASRRSDGNQAGTANVSFVSVEPTAMTSLGGVVAEATSAGRCVDSCFDRYANTRAIFIRDRVFALMGDELVEVSLGASGVTERARIDFGLRAEQR